MGLRFILNGRVMDDGETPNQETAEAPIQGVDGRTLILYVQSVYHQDGSAVRISDRVDIGGRPLPPSGSYTQVLSTSKTGRSHRSFARPGYSESHQGKNNGRRH